MKKTNSPQLDTVQLVGMCQTNQTADLILHSWGIRNRDRAECDLRRTRKALLNTGYKVSDDEYKAFFEALQALGLGRIEKSAHGHPRRFLSDYSLRSIGLVAAGEKGAELKPYLSRTRRAKRPVAVSIIKPRPIVLPPRPVAATVKPVAPVAHVVRLTLTVNGQAVQALLDNVTDAADFLSKLRVG